MSLETQLRESLLSHAVAAPAGADLLDGVRMRHKRFRRGRWSAIAAGIAAMLGATVMVPWLAGGIRQEPAIFPPSTLVTANFEMPYFPYEFGWLPPGAGEIRVEHLIVDPGTQAQAQVKDGYVFVWVTDHQIGVRQPVPAGEVRVETVVAGHPAKQLSGVDPNNRPWVMLSWEQDGRWLTVQSGGQVTPADVKRIGEGLRPGRIEIQNPIKLRLAPDGWVVGVAGIDLRAERPVTQVTPVPLVTTSPAQDQPTPHSTARYTLCLTKSRDAYYDLQYLCVDAEKEKFLGPLQDPRVKKVTVNGADAWLISGEKALPDETGPTVVFGSGGWTITARSGRGPRLTDEELIRFAEGISIVEP